MSNTGEKMLSAEMAYKGKTRHTGPSWQDNKKEWCDLSSHIQCSRS